jgi:hypothetical protein
VSGHVVPNVPPVSAYVAPVLAQLAMVASEGVGIAPDVATIAVQLTGVVAKILSFGEHSRRVAG